MIIFTINDRFNLWLERFSSVGIFIFYSPSSTPSIFLEFPNEPSPFSPPFPESLPMRDENGLNAKIPNRNTHTIILWRSIIPKLTLDESVIGQKYAISVKLSFDCVSRQGIGIFQHFIFLTIWHVISKHRTGRVWVATFKPWWWTSGWWTHWQGGCYISHVSHGLVCCHQQIFNICKLISQNIN